MPEIICVSCWKGFEIEEPPPPSVNCPHCDFAQPGRVADTTGVGVQAMPDEPAETAEADPFESMEAEIASNLEADGEQDEAAEEPDDTRWSIQTNTGLLLFFPEADLASQWAEGQDDDHLQIAYGRGPLRAYGAFQEALKTTSDPIQALATVAHSDDSASGEALGLEAIVQEAGAPASSPATPPASEEAPAPAETPEAPAEGGDAPGAGSRPATMTSEFQFRTDSAGSPWKSRLIFLVVGLIAGACGVYYAAWLGELPGILY